MTLNIGFCVLCGELFLSEDERANERIEIQETFKNQTNYKDRPVGYFFNQILMHFNGLF